MSALFGRRLAAATAGQSSLAFRLQHAPVVQWSAWRPISVTAGQLAFRQEQQRDYDRPRPPMRNRDSDRQGGDRGGFSNYRRNSDGDRGFPRRDSGRSSSSDAIFEKFARARHEAPQPAETADNGPKKPMELSEFKDMKWADVPGMSPHIKQAMDTVFKYEDCSPVQSAVFSRMPLQKDVLVQAKTGTGKTLAFLVPALDACKGQFDKLGKKASILIMSPTRELATQIADEAYKLVSYERLGVKCLVGGESKHAQLQSLERGRCDIIVGTPGRLIDLIESVPGFRERLENVKTLVLDEADRMLEIGFREPITHIISNLPQERRTMLFSATYPPNVKALGSVALEPDFEVINTISPEDAQTVDKIDQKYVVAPMVDHPKILHSILSRGRQAFGPGGSFKAIVFFPTTSMTILYAELFKFARMPVLELHSKKNQSKRSRVSDDFRRFKSGVLFTSDVSARGVDYPDVNLVVQMGVADSKDQYVHRIGRTGRAGKIGEAVAIYAPFEEYFLQQLKDFPIKPAELVNGSPELRVTEGAPHDLEKSDKIMKRAASYSDKRLARDSITGTLGFYSGKVDDMRKNNTLPKAILEGYQEVCEELYEIPMPPVPSMIAPLFERELVQHQHRRSAMHSGQRNGGGYGKRSNLQSRSVNSRYDRDDFDDRRPSQQHRRNRY
ncbi:hypothetical protein RI367_000596 [Sorochytrium milnesiophthora]